MATLLRHYPNEVPNGIITIFTYPAVAVSNVQFQQFRNGDLVNEVDDYTIAIGLAATVVTFVVAPNVGDQVVAYF